MLLRFATPPLSRNLSIALLGAAALVACRGPEFVGETTGTGGGTTTTTSVGGSGVGGATGGTGGTGGSGGGAPTDITVSVEVVDRDGGPLDTIPVLVSDPSGAGIGTLAQTALNGKVSVVVPIGGQVSAFIDGDLAYAYSAVVTASTTQVRIVHAFTPTNTHSPVTVNQQAYCPDCVSGDTMRWSLPCRSSVNPVTTVGSQTNTAAGYVGCPGQEEQESYVLWYGSTGTLKGFGRRVPQPFGTTSDSINSFATVAVSPVSLTTSVTNLPANHAPTKSIRASVPSGVGFNATIGTSASSETIELEGTVVPNLDLFITVDDVGGTIPTKVRYARHFDPFSGATVSFDSGLGLSGGGTFDGAEITVAFGGATGDLTQAHLESANQRWILVAPKMASGKIRVPTLPSSLSSFEAPGSATVISESIDSLGVTTYQAQLARGIAADPVDLEDPDGIRWSTDAD